MLHTACIHTNKSGGETLNSFEQPNLQEISSRGLTTLRPHSSLLSTETFGRMCPEFRVYGDKSHEQQITALKNEIQTK